MRPVSLAATLRCSAAVGTATALAWALAAAPVATAADREEPGAELAFGVTAPIEGVRPGSAQAVSFTVTNRGTAPATQVALYIDGSQGLAFVEKYANCRYENTPAQDEGPAQVNAVCAVDQTLEPGSVYALEEPVGVTLADRALYEQLSFTIQQDPAGLPGGADDGGAGKPVLRLVEQRPPADPGATYGYERLDVDITAKNTADFALTGSTVKGKAGDTVTAEVSFANKGPAWVTNDVSSPIGVFDVGVPSGTTVVKAPEFCAPAGTGNKPTSYHCTTPYDYADEHSERAYPFRLRIDKVVKNATGKVAFVKGDHRSGTLPFDENPKNNAARVVVNPTAAGGGSGSTGGSEPTDGPSSGATSGGATSGGSTQGTGTQTDTLAASGTDGSLLIGGTAAALLLTAGGVLVVRRQGKSTAAR